MKRALLASVIAIFTAVLAVPVTAGEIPDFWFKSPASQVATLTLDTGNFLVLDQDAESGIHVFEVTPDESIVDTFSCPYDLGRNITNPSMDVFNGNIHLVWTCEGHGRYTHCDMSNKQWYSLITYNHDLQWAAIDQISIAIDENGIIYAAAIGWHSKLGPDLNVLGLRSTNGGKSWNNWMSRNSIRNMLNQGYNWRQTLCVSQDTSEVDQKMVSIGMYEGNAHVIWLDPRQAPEVGFDLYRDAWVASGDSLMFGYRDNLNVTNSHDVTLVRYATYEGKSIYTFAQEYAVWVYGANFSKVGSTTSPVTHIGLDAKTMSQQACVWATEDSDVYYATGGYYGDWTEPAFLANGNSPNVAADDNHFLIAYNGELGINFRVIDFE